MTTDYSLHTHTFGFDGRNTEEQMIIAARARGMKTLGFSNHFIVHPYIRRSRMYDYAARGGYANIYNDDVENALRAFREHYDNVRKLQEKYTDMNILCGMEMDWFQYEGWRDIANYAVCRLNPDYVIGAMHFIDRGTDGVLNVHDIKNANSRESGRLLREYYQNLMQLAEFDWRNMGFKFNWVAHFDLPKKVGLNYRDMEHAALTELAKYQMPIELNSSLIMNYNYLILSDIFDKIGELNLPVLISDDAHDVMRIGADFDNILHIASMHGIKNVCVKSDMLKKFVGVRTY
jgi:HisJ family histidinol phosphate phosphatase